MSETRMILAHIEEINTRLGRMERWQARHFELHREGEGRITRVETQLTIRSALGALGLVLSQLGARVTAAGGLW